MVRTGQVSHGRNGKVRQSGRGSDWYGPDRYDESCHGLAVTEWPGEHRSGSVSQGILWYGLAVQIWTGTARLGVWQ